jgi:phosphoribosylamine--glycine ligase
MQKVLLIGSGAREHAMASALKKSGAVLYAVVKNANPGILALSERVLLHDELDSPAIVDFAKQQAIDFAVVGPEAPLAAGVSNALEKAGVSCASPSREAAQLETNKFFTRDLMRAAQLPCQTPWQVFDEANAVRDFIQNAESAVVKPLGLTGGKGVKILGETLATKQDAIAYASELIKKDGRVLVEEKLVGEEFTLQAFVAGGECTPMPLVQDFKRAFEGDTGPMTGGMGS